MQKFDLTFKGLMSLIEDNPLLTSTKVKYVRHKDTKEFTNLFDDVLSNIKDLENYQRLQSTDVFKDIEYIVSFIGIESRKSLFWGVFQIKNSFLNSDNLYEYELEEVELFENLKFRVVIDWGKAALSWHQHYQNTDKDILEIYHKGSLGKFPGYDELVITSPELQILNQFRDANKSWINALSVVSGVYLIVDKNSEPEKQYIGSAYGNNGIWGRWSYYAMSKHGDNKQLIDLCSLSDNYSDKFTFSILKTMPKNASKNEVIAMENLYKKKLGTRVHGLNSN